MGGGDGRDKRHERCALKTLNGAISRMKRPLLRGMAANDGLHRPAAGSIMSLGAQIVTLMLRTGVHMGNIGLYTVVKTF